MMVVIRPVNTVRLLKTGVVDAAAVLSAGAVRAVSAAAVMCDPATDASG